MPTVPMPTANLTKLGFGGEDLKTAYVTSARDRPERREARRATARGQPAGVRIPGRRVSRRREVKLS